MGPLGDGCAGGATILGSRSSGGGSTAYEVMNEYRDQVISPVTTEEVYFSTPVGTRGGVAPGREFGSSPFARTPTQDTPSGPSNRPKDSSGLQMALLSLVRQLGGPTGPGLGNVLPPSASQGMSAGARTRFGGDRKVPQGPEDPNIGAGTKVKKVAGDLKLYHYGSQDRHLICGGIISKRGGGANFFCVATNCGFAHDKKVFDRLEDGAYYIFDSGGVAGLGQASNPVLSSSPHYARRQLSTPWPTRRS